MQTLLPTRGIKTQFGKRTTYMNSVKKNMALTGYKHDIKHMLNS
jgi:hypothetical protein